jgi:dipeptidase D
VELMTEPLEGAEPALLWKHFEALAGIARPSRHEEAAVAHVKAWAGEKGFEVVPAGGTNLIVRVPATPGRESAPTVILQGHLDMVCERRPDSPYDPAEGRIKLVRDGEWLTADGTTLGADDGIAIVSMMAIAEDSNVAHGPLEMLMTMAEEVGLEGAKSIDGSTLTGRMLLNLDSEEDGRLTVGCAGSTDTFVRVQGERGPVSAGYVALTVTASGGKGGHSGQNIDDGRSNAIKAVARALRETLEKTSFRLVSLDGGKSRNAIPRDAAAVCVVAQGQAEAFRQGIQAASDLIADAFKNTDPDVHLAVGEADMPADAWMDEATRTMLDVIVALPSGIQTLSPDFEGLVEMSTSLGVATTEGGQLELHSLTRTSNESALPEVVNTLAGISSLAGAFLEVKHGYAGWRPDLKSPLLASTVAVYKNIFGEQPIVTAVHAGLETALIGEKVKGGLDMLSIGPQIEFPHSPDERVSVPTVERFWRLLVGVLDDLSKGS